ncbi:MAG: tetratricopeptide repeat protein [Bacteroidota bacterium]
MAAPITMPQRDEAACEFLVKELLEDGEARLAAGDLAEAMACFGIASQLAPTMADIKVFLGRCTLEAGFPKAALALFEEARAAGFQGADLSGYMGRAYGRNHDWGAAETCFRTAIELDPASFEWRRELLTCLRHMNRDTEAFENAQAVAQSYPRDWQCWNDLAGFALHLGQFDQAETWARRAAALAPSEGKVHETLADLHFLRGDAASALKEREQAIEIGGAKFMSAAPYFHPVPYDKGMSPPVIARLRDRLRRAMHSAPGLPWLVQADAQCAVLEGNFAEAEAMLRALLASDSENLSALLDLCLVGLVQGAAAETLPAPPSRQFDTSIPHLIYQRQGTPRADVGLDFGCRRKLLNELWNDSGLERLARWIGPVAGTTFYGHLVMAFLHYERGDIEQGRLAHQSWVSVLTDAHYARPERTIAPHLSLCLLLEDLDLPSEVDRVWKQYLHRPEALIKLICGVFSLIHSYRDSEKLAEVAFNEIERLPEILAAHPAPEQIWQHAILAASFLPNTDAAYDRTCRQALAFYKERAASVPAFPRKPDSATPAERRIRVGYVMTDFSHQDLPSEQFVLTFHDQRRVEVFVYYFTPSVAAHVRPTRPAPPVLANWWGSLRDINDMDARQAAQRIAEDGIDILVDTVGWWVHEIPELFVLRPAPIQVTWLGLGRPGKAGVIDYIVGNEDLFPRHYDELYPEKFIRLEGCYIPPKPLPQDIPATPRRLLGLPEDKFIYLAYHQAMKVSARSLRLWMEILRRTPDSMLLLPALGIREVETAAREAGVDLERIRYFRWVRTELENISRIGAGDVYLDTVPFNSSGLTGYDAIAMGVPRVTLCDRNLYSRFGLVLQNSMGLGDLVCFSEADFIDLAVALRNDPERLGAIRAKMAEARRVSPAMDPNILMRGIEDAWERIANDYRRGLKPHGFDVPMATSQGIPESGKKMGRTG